MKAQNNPHMLGRVFARRGRSLPCSLLSCSMPFESLLVGVEHKGRAWLMIGHWFVTALGRRCICQDVSLTNAAMDVVAGEGTHIWGNDFSKGCLWYESVFSSWKIFCAFLPWCVGVLASIGLWIIKKRELCYVCSLMEELIFVEIYNMVRRLSNVSLLRMFVKVCIMVRQLNNISLLRTKPHKHNTSHDEHWRRVHVSRTG